MGEYCPLNCYDKFKLLSNTKKNTSRKYVAFSSSFVSTIGSIVSTNTKTLLYLFFFYFSSFSWFRLEFIYASVSLCIIFVFLLNFHFICFSLKWELGVCLSFFSFPYILIMKILYCFLHFPYSCVVYLSTFVFLFFFALKKSYNLAIFVIVWPFSYYLLW